MSALLDYENSSGTANIGGATPDFAPPEVPSYLIGSDNHQLGATGSSILDPTSWGDRIDNGFKFSVSALTRAVASTYNSAVTVGSIFGITTDDDKAKTEDWLSSMDDDLSQYYMRNKSSIDVVGDVVGMFAPGLAGMKLFNYAQKGIAMATEGRAGLNLASHFGTLPSKQAMFAKLAAADMANTGNTFSLINANLAKSLAAGYAQNALEFAAFDVAASLTMKDSPLFKDHDMSDIAYNALLGGGMIGAGIIGTAVAARTVMEVKAAGKAVDEATHAWRTVLTEPAANTPKSEALAIHLNNIEAIPTIAKEDALYVQKSRAATETRAAELDNGRSASHVLAKTDKELGNTFFDTLRMTSGGDASNVLAGLVRTSRMSVEVPEAKILGDNAYTKYLKLQGEDFGTIVEGSPVLRMADKLKTEDAVLAKAKFYGHKQGQDWSAVNNVADADSIEARYITAMEGKFNPDIKIGTRDIPFLERAYAENVPLITLKDGRELDPPALYNYLRNLKGEEALKIQEQNLVAIGEDALTPEAVANLVNVSPDYLKGMINERDPSRTFFALQTTAKDHTDKLISLGERSPDQGLVKTYLQPTHAKLIYDTSKVDILNEWETRGMIAIKQQQTIYRQDAINVTNNFFKEDSAYLPNAIPGHLMPVANREGVGGGLFTSMNGGYKTLASFSQQVGAITSGILKKAADKVTERFTPSGAKLLNDPDAGLEFAKVIQQTRQTPEKYVLQGNMLRNRKLVRYEQELQDYEQTVAAAKNAGKSEKEIAAITKPHAPVYEDAKAPTEIPLETKGVQEFASEWHSANATHRIHQANLHNNTGLTTQDSLADVFYMPPVDGRKFPHFAFVVDDSISNTGHVRTIHAASAQELEALAAKVPTEQGLRVIYKDQSERWHRAMADYDYELGINENYIDSALKRSGVSASYMPKTDPQALLDELLTWRKNQDSGLIRAMLEHRFSPEFAELRRQGAQYRMAETSRVGYVSDVLKKKISDPYTGYIDAMLYKDREGTTPIWSAVNRLAETSISAAVSKLQDTWKATKSPEDLAKVNEMLKSIGVSTYEDAATLALANHTAPKPILANWVRKANSLLSFTMLRSDPLNAVNNGIGHAVLYGAELPSMIKQVLSTGGADEFRNLAQIKLPGVDAWVTSPVKLASKAYGNWWNKVIGKADGGALYARYKELNLLPSYTDQLASMTDQLALKGSESAGELSARMAKAYKLMDTIEKYSGNKFAEEMNRFVAADTARMVSDMAVKHGVITPDLAPSIINTFVNRTQGNMLAAQRPLMFRGPVGQAIGLFQTYQFNMLQQMFRYVGEGNNKSTAILLGLQGSIYGMNGLPAFNALNNYLVGNAAGNKSHSDIVSTTYDAAGKELGDWLLYGAASNMMLHPDAKVNLYSRGDINPRQVTVIPTQLADVPMIGAATKLFGSVYNAVNKMDKGASIWGSILQGVEHSGISRPLSGFAQVLQATNNPNGKVTSTDNAGNITMQNDLFSMMTAARLLGAKPLDEAVALDAFHRVQVYSAARSKDLNILGQSIKATVAGGNIPTQEQINEFASSYAKAGGMQDKFAGFLNRQVLNANRSKVNQLTSNINNPFSVYMQKMMGGYELQDYINSNNK